MSVPAFRIERAGPGRLAASGELGFATATAALAAGLELIGPGQAWTVDLAGITAGDSAGLAVLVEWLSAARERDATLRYAAVPPQILAIARISDLESLLVAQSAGASSTGASSGVSGSSSMTSSSSGGSNSSGTSPS